jgi:hypothetical protein
VKVWARSRGANHPFEATVAVHGAPGWKRSARSGAPDASKRQMSKRTSIVGLPNAEATSQERKICLRA